jgi:ATP-dependent Clp protease ATP-binding subunit ClpA
LEENVLRALREHFRPEFLNRIDEVIVFEPLTEAELQPIVDLLLEEVRERLGERGIGLTLTEAAKTALVKEGYDPAFGARPLRRVIQRRVENAVSKHVLSGAFTDGDTVVVDHTPDGFSFGKATPEPAAVA